jgi:acyl-CoA reductase-like NAD-dependent aldehyde dehydrogenase
MTRAARETIRPFFVGGRASTGAGSIRVLEKFTGKLIAHVATAGAADVSAAIDAASAGAQAMRDLPVHRRREALFHLASRVGQHAENLASMLTAEAGKPVTDARAEVVRAIDTLTAAAEESTRIRGEYLPLDASPRGEGLEAIVKRVPVGPCSLITPFNFPLNLACHKVGPAIAAGCPFILKPDPRTPQTSLMLGEWLAETSLPTGAASVLPIIDESARDLLITDERLRLISFTGSGPVGWGIRARAGTKRVILELGGVAACIVDAPLSDAEIERAATRIAAGAFGFAGQSCISVQRVLVHADLYERASAALVRNATSMPVGDPRDEATRIGPLISEDAARRVEAWIQEAVAGGGRVLCGGTRRGAILEPTIVESAPAHSRLETEEVFGPVATLRRIASFDEGLALANATRFGLQHGAFTSNLNHAFRAFDALEAGAVVINDIPTTRVDVMPYGGVKSSGLGREGLRYAIEEMTELRAMIRRRV